MQDGHTSNDNFGNNYVASSEQEYLMLISRHPELLDKTIVKPEYFYNKRNRIIFKTLYEEYKKHKSYISEYLIQYSGFDSQYFATLLIDGEMYDSSKETKFKELEKNLIQIYKSNESKTIVKQYNGDFNNLKQKIIELDNINYNENEYVKAKDILETLNNSNKKVELGYPKLDYNLNLSQHDLLIIAGGTGTGKTAFALNLLDNLSHKYPCIYFNMEMSKNVLYKRLLSINTSIDITKLNKINELEDKEKNLLREAMRDIESRKIMLVNKSMNIEEIKREIANINTDNHIIVFADHIGLINSKGNSLYEKMTNIAKELRAISLNYNCTVIGLCQLSRDSQRNNDKSPALQDLRDSGEIEQSARKVLLLYNPNQQDFNSKDMQLIIAKNDDGIKTVIEFKFDKKMQLFTEKYY